MLIYMIKPFFISIYLYAEFAESALRVDSIKFVLLIVGSSSALQFFKLFAELGTYCKDNQIARYPECKTVEHLQRT